VAGFVWGTASMSGRPALQRDAVRACGSLARRTFLRGACPCAYRFIGLPPLNSFVGPARSTGPALSCPLREDVRIFLHQWKQCGSSPTVEKVTAHDSMAIQAGDVRACGNDHAERLAKAAAASHLTPEVYARDPRFADAAVRVRDSHGGWVTDLAPAITAFWWSATRRAAWLAQLFPAGMAIEWGPRSSSSALQLW